MSEMTYQSSISPNQKKTKFSSDSPEAFNYQLKGYNKKLDNSNMQYISSFEKKENHAKNRKMQQARYNNIKRFRREFP